MSSRPVSVNPEFILASVSQKQPVGSDEDGQNRMAISGLARAFRVWKTFLNEAAAGEACAGSGAEAQG
jgi:hypothetical protein